MAMLVGLFTRRPDLSADEFRSYYETRHAPFNLTQFRHLLTGYSRSYVSNDRHNTRPEDRPEDRPVDVVTRIEFADDAGMAEMFRLSHTIPGHSAAIAADEQAFMDRGATHLLLTSGDVRIPLGRELATAPASITALITRRPDLTRAQFQEHYESTHVPLVISRFQHLMTSWTHAYVTKDFLNTGPGDRPVDAVAYLEFPDADAMSEMLALLSDTPGLQRDIDADAAKFIDRDRTHVLLSVERGGFVAADRLRTS